MSKQGNYRANKKAKKKALTQFSGIMKGLLEYKQDLQEVERLQDEIKKLQDKYPYDYEIQPKWGGYAMGAYA